MHTKNTLYFLLAPGGAASFDAGVRLQRYSGSRDDVNQKTFCFPLLLQLLLLIYFLNGVFGGVDFEFETYFVAH